MEKLENPLIYSNQERIPQKYYAVYDRKKSPDRFHFMDSQKWPLNFEGEIKNFDGEVLSKPYSFIFEVDVEGDKLLRYDFLPNTFGSLLVNEKVLAILMNVCPNDFQVLDSTFIHAKDRVLTNYKLLNILRLVDCIDLEKSWCSLHKNGSIDRIRNLFFKPGCMGNMHLARNKQFEPMIVVSQALAKAFKKEKIKGARFVTDRERISNELFPEEYLAAMFHEDPEAAKRYFVSKLNDKEEYTFFKTRVSKIPRNVLETLIDMTLSRSSFHKDQCEEILKIMENEGEIYKFPPA